MLVIVALIVGGLIGVTLMCILAVSKPQGECWWFYTGSCTFKTECDHEYVDESDDPLPEVCPFCGRSALVGVS